MIANTFNKYFCSLAENLNKSINNRNSKWNNFRNYLPKAVESSIFTEDTTNDEIIEIIKEFHNDKSSDIPIVVEKHTAEIIAPMLCKMYNVCTREGTFPQILKHGKITPIYKKGPRDSIENYRPISTLPIFGKIFEKILYTRKYNYITSKNILSDTQFGFRKDHSATVMNNIDTSIAIGSSSIKKVSEARFLGVVFDPSINWNFYIEEL